MPDAAAAGLAPHPLHRAGVEAMLASLVAQLLARRHHGEPRFVPHGVGGGAGRAPPPPKAPTTARGGATAIINTIRKG